MTSNINLLDIMYLLIVTQTMMLITMKSEQTAIWNSHARLGMFNLIQYKGIDNVTTIPARRREKEH